MESEFLSSQTSFLFSGVQQIPFLTGTVPEDGIAVHRALISIATSH